MEEKEGLNGAGVTVKGDEAPESYRVEPRVENSGQHSGSTAPPTPAVPVSGVATTTEMKKKRGRPRKYAADGSIVALSPMPISASIPLTGDYSGWKQSSARPVDSFKKKHKLDFGNPGRTASYPASGSFTPHMITVNPGEDIMMKIISFSQQGSRAICILAANGTISNVTLRQPNSSGGTLTYEGRFEILSLTGSFMPSDNGVTKSRSGGMSVSLAGPDGRVLGGGLAGMLVAAGPVQVVIGSFLPGQEQEQKPKKTKYEHTISFAPVPANPLSEERYESPYSGPKPNLTTSVSYHGDNLTSVNSMHGSKPTEPKNNAPLAGEDSRDQNQEVTC
ncbi:hypothetical protein CDL12_09141 [Handroanthus impetiginosus]|uniref:AT-hook motif nuclear-localized protein n=1 Tax=Handroanthus impetiginosus TaxID=429701 RepID=A0A2G9HKY8_9LAMI|nr:hypothetical protein CDL12_09141 [Handroanthus impetiginosus]